MDRFAEWREVPFTDIDNFDYNNFTFFTYSVHLDTSSDYFKNLISNSKLYDKHQDFDISLNPESLWRKKRISVALTTSNDYYTYGRIGYVVSSPIENILYVGQAPFNDTNDQLRNKRLNSPNDIFSGNVFFNEVVLEGSTIYGNVLPVAIFINLTDATLEERIQVEWKLGKIREATFDFYPILDLTKEKKLDSKSIISK